MVVFTCNHCGESLQKPRVEKHYQTSCHNPIAVTCMDCFKDFKLLEYVAHTKCITEDERYSAKGTVQGGAKKGEMKQMSWVATINNIIETHTNLNTNEKSLLDIISKHENVPRKKNKFVNFMKSMSGGRVNLQDVEAVWNILEEQKVRLTESKKSNVENKENGDVNGKKKRKANTDIDDDVTKTKKDTEDGETNTESKKSKKKKKSDSLILNENKNELDTEESQIVTDKKKSKKKKKSKNEHSENTLESASNEKTEGIIQDAENIVNDSKKKKKKRKIENDETKLEELTKVPENGEIPEKKIDDNEEIVNNDEVPKKKKKKNKQLVMEEVKQEEIVNTEVTNKKKKNKKSTSNETKMEEAQTVNSIEEVTSTETVNGDTPKKKKNKKLVNGADHVDETNMPVNGNEKEENKFDTKSNTDAFPWCEKILEILKNHENGITKQDLQKKLTKIYKKIKGEEPSKNQIKTYNRKMNKMPDVEVNDEMISLK